MANVIRYCKWCKDPFAARAADVKRGWAKFCSKSCKARHQERRTGQHASFIHRQIMRDVEVGTFGYKDIGP